MYEGAAGVLDLRVFQGIRLPQQSTGCPQPNDVLHLCTLFQNLKYLYAIFFRYIAHFPI